MIAARRLFQKAYHMPIKRIIIFKFQQKQMGDYLRRPLNRGKRFPEIYTP